MNKVRSIIRILVIGIVTGTLFWQCEETCELEKLPLVHPQSFSVEENSPNGTVVGKVSATAGDAESKLIYSIITGSENGTFSIDSLSGEIFVSDSANIDYETRTSYELAVQVTQLSKNILTSTAPISVTILDVDEISLCTISVPLDGLVAYYPLDGDATDSSGNNYHGTVLNAGFGTDRNSQIDHAATFSGQQASIGFPQSYDYQNRTVNLWFKAQEIGTDISILYESDHSGIMYAQTQLGVVEIDNQKYLDYLVGDPATNHHYQEIEEGVWYMMTVAVNQEMIAYYFNGELLHTLPYNGNIHAGDGNLFASLGVSRKNEYYFSGSIDQVRIYDRDLNATEIEALYQEGEEVECQ